MMSLATRTALFALCVPLTHGCDCGGTPPGTGDASGGDAWVGNRPPEVPVYTSITMLPGDSVSLISAPISDPDGDALSCAWTTIDPPLGVTLPSACDTPVIGVDRALYEGGPAEQRLDLALSVSDGVNPAVTATIEVIIGDERGGHVNNLSPWEGMGYLESGARHGWCGAAGHPCKTIDDAKNNLRRLIHEGADGDPTLLLATSGVDYTISAPILLDDDAGDTGIALSLECGFDPLTWERATGTWEHTPIRFSSEVGVHITADGVRLAGCDIAGAEPAAPVPGRTAVNVTDATAVIANNRLLAVPATLTSRPEIATGLSLVFTAADSTQRVEVLDNLIEGGIGTDFNFGVQSINGTPLISGNTIRGNAAPYASTVLARNIGLHIDTTIADGSASAWVRDNPLIEGGGSGTAGIGISVARGTVSIVDNALIAGCSENCRRTSNFYGLQSAGVAETVSLVNNTVIGADESAPVRSATGLHLFCRTLSQRNTISGGRADQAFGAWSAGGDFSSLRDHFTGGIGVDADTSDDTDGSAIGVQVSGGYLIATEAEITGARDGSAANADRAVGLRVSADGRARIIDGQIRSGRGVAAAIGVEMPAPAAPTVTLENCTVQADAAGGDLFEDSVGVYQESGALTIAGGAVSAGSGMSSRAIRAGRNSALDHGAASTTLTGCTLTTTGTQNSSGVSHGSGLLDLQDVTITTGHSSDTNQGISLYCQEDVCEAGPHRLRNISISTGRGYDVTGLVIGRAGGVELAGGQISAGEATEFDSIGVDIERSTVALSDVTATAGHAVRASAGLRVFDVGLTASRLTATGGDAPLTSGVDYRWANGGNIFDSVLTGGDCASGSGTASHGLRATSQTYTHFERNVLRGGDGCGASYGYYLAENGYATWLQDSVATGGQAENYSAGAWYAGECQACRVGYNTLRGGTTTSTTLTSARSVGLYLTATEFDTDPFYKTHVFSNRIFGGTSSVARGIELTGGSGQAVVVMHNNIHGQGTAGAAGSISSAVYLGRPAMVGLFTSGLFAFNIIDAGVASERFGFYEGCRQIANVGAWGAPWQVRRNVFWPSMTSTSNRPTAYVRHANTDDCAAPILYTALSDVNADDHYGQGNVHYTSLATDPEFERDGYHLASTSPLIDAAGVETLWPYDPQMAMLDIDGRARPCRADLDIGADEYCQ